MFTCINLYTDLLSIQIGEVWMGWPGPAAGASWGPGLVGRVGGTGRQAGLAGWAGDKALPA